VLYSADGFGAPVLLPATDADDLDDAYWQQAAATHARWSGSDGARAAALAALGTELIVPAFGPVLHGRRRAAALRATAPSSPPCATDAAYRARMEELLAIGC
jgi:hypothetical protein